MPNLEGWRVRWVGDVVVADLPRGDSGLIDFEVKLQRDRKKRVYFTYYGHQRDIECPLVVIDQMVALFMEKKS